MFAVAPLLTGKELTKEQIALENRNNIAGLLGALEKESISSFSGISCAVRTLTSRWNSYSYALLKPVVPYAAALLVAPLGKLLAMRMPHGKDGPSLEHGRVYREALGANPFFHGEELGPLDLSLYGTFACFLEVLGAPAAVEVLDTCDLRSWYERCDQRVKAIRPLDRAGEAERGV